MACGDSTELTVSDVHIIFMDDVSFQAAITKSLQRWHQQHTCMALQFVGRSVPSELEEGTCPAFSLELPLNVLFQKDTVIPDQGLPK